ncbi:MAG: hypothetical protein GXP45_08015 [bacterium]|nr:hypothetical protein [bacterium]
MSLKEKHPQLVSFPVQDVSLLKLSAGQLIDLCGFKKNREGDVGIYSKHALILVNYGQATGDQLWSFAKKIQFAVKEKFSIQLEAEVNIVG